MMFRIQFLIESKKCQYYTLNGACVSPLNDHYATLIYAKKYMTFKKYYPNTTFVLFYFVFNLTDDSSKVYCGVPLEMPDEKHM